MVLLNITGVPPISLPKNFISRSEPKRIPFLVGPLNPPASFLPHLKGLAYLSSALGAASSARALTYEELLNKTLSSSGDFGVGGIVDGVLKFSSENPLIVGGGASVLVLTLIVSQILGSSSKAWGVVSAKNAYAKLAEDAGAQLLDIRDVKEIKEVGSPDLRGLKKKAVAIFYSGEAKTKFLKKLALKFKDPGNTTLFVLDKFDGNSELVSDLVTANGFRGAYAIKGGAEGAQGWKNSELPWLPPKKTLFFDFGDLGDAIGETSDSIPITLALAAATGLGVFAFAETETLFQLLGSVAIIQFIIKKLLFAEDRKVTLKQIDEFLNTKVASKELSDEIKMLGNALLSADSSSQESTSTEASFTESKVERKEEVASQLTQTVNSFSRDKLEEKVAPRPTCLSPYPYYPDFKPPASPSPSKP